MDRCGNRKGLPGREIAQADINMVVHSPRLALLIIGDRDLAVADLQVLKLEGAGVLLGTRLTWLGSGSRFLLLRLRRIPGCRLANSGKVPYPLCVAYQLNMGPLECERLNVNLFADQREQRDGDIQFLRLGKGSAGKTRVLADADI